MTSYRIEVWAKDLGRRQRDHVEAIPVKLFFLQGEVNLDAIERLCSVALVDPVAEDYAINSVFQPEGVAHTIDVTLLPGVTDPAAESLLNAARLMDVFVGRAATGARYLLTMPADGVTLKRWAETVFSNPLIQRYRIDAPIDAPFVETQTADSTVALIALRGADDDTLLAISKERRLSLDIHEMRAIRAYFHEVERDPTDAELEMLAQTWSEHCVHKTFKARVDYTGPVGADPQGEVVTEPIDGILKTYLRAATEKVDKAWVRSAFVDNAGIIKFDDKLDLAFKVETHNRPSALEPFGGANTGVGGVIRDVLGVSAKPIANTDILFFGLPDMETLPEGVLHPEHVASGVVSGIEDYGNKMGIPTVNGGIFYHPGYVANPLVFCGCLGILPHGSHRTEAQAGDLIVVIGGRTGRDGLRGATFSSMEMDTTTSQLSGGAVQIGHPIHEKQVQEAVLRARDEGLYTAITDCGAGGLSSAVGEMGEKIGATVQLDAVPLKYPGLRPWEIWLSEAQERMVLAVPPENWERLQAICAGQDVEAVTIGTFDPTGRLTLHYGDVFVGDVTMAFLHDGIPQRHLQATWQAPEIQPSAMLDGEDYSETVLKLLALPSIRSKEQVVRRYDHEVQGATAVKPFVGVANAGPSDASVLVPSPSGGGASPRGAALSVGYCPQYTDFDPYAMAWAAVDEAMRNLVAVGADPRQVAILDNFSWGNTNLPDRMGSLVRTAQGCYDAAITYDVPYISGKDSLNNEYVGADGLRHAIPGTLVISALGIVPDVACTVTMDFKVTGSKLYLIGETGAEFGGSHYNLLHGIQGGIVPQPRHDALKTMIAVHEAIQSALIRACHDVSEGGVAVALAEMCLAGKIGANVDGLSPEMLFSESTGRFLVEVAPEHQAAFESAMGAVACMMIGETVSAAELIIRGDEKTLIALSLDAIEQAWRGHVAESALIARETKPFPPKRASTRTIPAQNGTPKVLILHANGTNRDYDAVQAVTLAGGAAEIVHVNQLTAGERHLRDYQMLVVPGGFSYGDDLGAGVLWALDLRERFGDDLRQFIAEGRPVLGICNGFQALVKAGVLPGDDVMRKVTLTANAHPAFECRWVYLEANPACPSLFTEGLSDEMLYVPIAHGEGRVLVADDATAQALWDEGLIGLRYVDASGKVAGYPINPNGSMLDIAGLSNRAGNVFGLMPHPENHVFAWQHPRYHRGERGNDGLRLFKNGIRFA